MVQPWSFPSLNYQLPPKEDIPFFLSLYLVTLSLLFAKVHSNKKLPFHIHQTRFKANSFSYITSKTQWCQEWSYIYHTSPELANVWWNMDSSTLPRVPQNGLKVPSFSTGRSGLEARGNPQKSKKGCSTKFHLMNGWTRPGGGVSLRIVTIWTLWAFQQTLIASHLILSLAKHHPTEINQTRLWRTS